MEIGIGQNTGRMRPEEAQRRLAREPEPQLGRQVNQTPLRGHLEEIGNEVGRLEQLIAQLGLIRDRLLGSRPEEAHQATLDHPAHSIDDHLRILRARLSERLSAFERIIAELDQGV